MAPDAGFRPCGLSGTVVGILLNHAPALQALDAAAHLLPYNMPPVAPVLYIKPRNCLAGDGAKVAVPADASELEMGATLGIVMGRTTCRVTPDEALDCVAGYTIVCDISIPHEVFYRPSVRLKARDGFCPMDPTVVSRDKVAAPDNLAVQVWVDDVLVQSARTSERIRPVAQLIADVSEFMTLAAGDVLMLGASAHAPRARAGQQIRIAMEGLGELGFTLVPEGLLS